MMSQRFAALKVVVVDDYKDAANSLAMLLRLEGHSVQTACDGPTALAVVEQQSPDVVLLDLGLPKMDGYAVAQVLRERPETKDTFIIAVTGYGQESDRERCKEAGFDLHLLKPVDTERLLGLLRRETSMLTDH